LAERRGAQRNNWSTGVNWRELRSTLLKNTKAMIFQNGAWRNTLGHAPHPARSKPVAPLRRKRQIVRHRASSCTPPVHAYLSKSPGLARATSHPRQAAHHLPLHLPAALRAAVTVGAARRFTFAKMHWKTTEIFLKSGDFCS